MQKSDKLNSVVIVKKDVYFKNMVSLVFDEAKL